MKWWHWLLIEISIMFGIATWIYFFPSADRVDDFVKSFFGFTLIYIIESLSRRKND